MSSFVLTLDHAKSKSEDVTKDAGNLQGFCVFSGDGQLLPAGASLPAQSTIKHTGSFKRSLPASCLPRSTYIHVGKKKARL